MSTTINRDEVYTGVEEVLIEALGVDNDEVTADATLTTDLGAESIDFLDIVFRLEKNFGIKIAKGELFPDDILNDPANQDSGKLTEKGLAQLKASMPHADFTDFEKDPSVAKMPDLFTVNTIVNYVQAKLQAS
jgi:acyl carrier protein